MYGDLSYHESLIFQVEAGFGAGIQNITKIKIILKTHEFTCKIWRLATKMNEI